MNVRVSVVIILTLRNSYKFVDRMERCKHFNNCLATQWKITWELLLYGKDVFIYSLIEVRTCAVQISCTHFVIYVNIFLDGKRSCYNTLFSASEKLRVTTATLVFVFGPHEHYIQTYKTGFRDSEANATKRHSHCRVPLKNSSETGQQATMADQIACSMEDN